MTLVRRFAPVSALATLAVTLLAAAAPSNPPASSASGAVARTDSSAHAVPVDRDAALAELVATERRFAETCGRVGFRTSFLEFLAEDGLNFSPGPTRFREELTKQPPEKEDFLLTWEPAFADVAASGELGYTTGPYTVVEKRGTPEQSERYGTFFSIWRRDAAGTWKLASDAGVRSPSRPPVARVASAPPGVASPGATAAATRDVLVALDVQLLAGAARDRRAAYEPFVDGAARLHRPGMVPVLGRDAIVAFLAQEGGTLVGETLGVGAASSGDLGYTYGRYTLRPAGGDAVEGFYVRMWKHTAAGWRIVVDTANRVPPAPAAPAG